MTNRTCSECEKPYWSRGYCKYHWTFYRRSGELQLKPKKSAEQRFWEKVDRSAECWLWTARIDRLGYGHFRYQGTMWLAHRAIWHMTYGEIPEGMEIDHRCLDRSCVRLDHLRLVTRKQNMEHQAGAHKNSKTGVRGVWQDARDGRLYCAVRHNNEIFRWGPFDTVDEADAVVRAKRAELFTHDDAIY